MACEVVIVNRTRAGVKVLPWGANAETTPRLALSIEQSPFRTGQYKGKTLLLTFICTRCPIPEYCTLMSNNFSQIDQELQKQPELYEKTRLLSISIDPDYDTPAVLRSYGASHTGRFGDETFSHWAFATGTNNRNGVARSWTAVLPGKVRLSMADARDHRSDGKVHKVNRDNKWKPEEVLKIFRWSS